MLHQKIMVAIKNCNNLLNSTSMNSLLFRLPLILVFTYCSGQTNDPTNKELILSFEENVLRQESLDLEKFYDHTKVHKSIKRTKELELLITNIFESYKLGHCNGEKETVLSYDEAMESEELKSILNIDKLEYSRKNEVFFYLPSEECLKENKLYIVRNKKIISFFNYIYWRDQSPLKPFLLNKKHDRENLKVMRL